MSGKTATAAAVSNDGKGPLIFIVAGEPSGDQLAARLMAALKVQTSGSVRFAGIGGDAMAAEGLRSLFPLSELAVMGLLDVVPHVLGIYRKVKRSVAEVRALRPDAVVTVDSPSFTFEITGRLVGAGFPLIHYVSPKVWAWKAWRAKAIAKILDHLILILPFEEEIYRPLRLPTTYVGHAAVEAASVPVDAVSFRAQHGIEPDAPLVCLLPGSRRAEIKNHLEIYRECLVLLKRSHPQLSVVLPTVSTVSDLVRAQTANFPVPIRVVEGREAKLATFAASTVALATSGTVALETAIAGLPTVVGYRLTGPARVLPVSWIKVPYVSLVNLVLNRLVQPEFLQRRCRPELLARALDEILDDPAARKAQRESALEAARLLGLGGEAPSLKAAKAVLAVISEHQAGAKVGSRRS